MPGQVATLGASEYGLEDGPRQWGSAPERCAQCTCCERRYESERFLGWQCTARPEVRWGYDRTQLDSTCCHSARTLEGAAVDLIDLLDNYVCLLKAGDQAAGMGVYYLARKLADVSILAQHKRMRGEE